MKSAIAAVFGAVLGALAAVGPALAQNTWDGTWVGDAPDSGSGVQLIFAGNNLVGFFWNGDYIEMRAIYSMTDGVVTITWNRGQAIVTRVGPREAHMVVLQRNLADQYVVIFPED